MGLDFWQETDFLECVSSAVHCSQLCLRTRTFDIESDQSFCDNSLGNQGDDVLGPWDFLRWSSSNCQDEKRKQRKKSYSSCSLSANGKQNQRSKTTNGRWKGWERWECSHPFQNSSHVVGFQWEDWDITVFCLDSFFHLGFPKTF